MVRCDGSTNNAPATITVKLADSTNTGTFSVPQNIPIKSETLDINKCTYTPKSTKTTLPNKNNIPYISKLYNTNKFIVNNITVNNSCNLIPRGLIIAFYGKTIPDGWTLCDGTLCTPDLRGRSILGFDSINNKNNIGQYGGEESHLLSISELPIHNHKYSASQAGVSFVYDVDRVGGREWTPGKSLNAVAHQTYLNETTNLPHNNMPPYTVCSYIMKL